LNNALKMWENFWILGSIPREDAGHQQTRATQFDAAMDTKAATTVATADGGKRTRSAS
jgi:hypothetical protein